MNEQRFSRDEIEKYLSKDLDELMKELGEEAKKKNYVLRGSSEGDPGYGYHVFDSIKDKLFKEICEEWDYCKKSKDPDWNDSVDLAIAIAEFISTLAIGFSIVIITSIIVKKGLNEFCKC